jgi:uncharacterized phage protein (TIGR02218 family)
MTDAREDQAGAVVLAAALAAEVRADQAGSIVLASTTSLGIRTDQAGAIVLCDMYPCLTHYAQCWSITRTDGVVFGFTSCDIPIEFDGLTYSPCDSLSASANELGALIGQVGSTEISGIISDDAISDADLLAGLFDEARVEAWMVPWDGVGDLWCLFAGKTGKLTQGRKGYTMEVLTAGARFQQAALIQTYTAGCRFELGDARCKFNLAGATVSGSVTSTVPVDDSTAANRRIFADSSRSEPTGTYSRGKLTWLTGANAGQSSEIKDYFGANGQFVLWQPMPYAIEVGDTYEAEPGCDKAPETCTGVFSNFVNFGGFKDVPLEDSVRQTPPARQG